MNRSRRLLAVGILILLVGGICVHYGTTYEENWPHPTGEQLSENPGGWDGEQVLLFGEVQERTATGFVMTVNDDAGDVARRVTVRGADSAAAVGGTVQVYGILSEQGTVQDAESVVVVNEDSGDQQYKLGTSVIGVLLAAGLFLRYWQIDWARLGFARREAVEGGERDG